MLMLGESIVYADVAILRKGEPMEHKQPYCFKCRMFYKDKGKRYPTAHCAFEIYVRCTGRLHGEKPERRTDD